MADLAHLSTALRSARRLLLVPPAGRTGDLAPALRRLRQTLPDATLVPLTDLPVDPSGALPLVDRLAAARLDAALVFTAEGDSAFEAAYLAYLAGIPVRAGLSAEFGGGVLAPWIRPPPSGTPPARRHLHLLGELGL